MRQISESTTVVCPIGGLNAYDALSSMGKEDAIILRNWYPSSYGCVLRKGTVKHADGFNGEVETGMVWKSNTGVETIFAIDQDGIYDITLPGDVTAPPDVLLTEPKVQHVSMGNDAGTHLIGFNGVDDGIWYSDTGWQRLTAGDGVDVGTWNGVDPADLIHCTIHQRRLWAIEKDSAIGWYLPPNQIFGIASNFDFGPVFSRGGYLQALTTWTRDSGDGSDDYLLAISSSGEVAVYQGIDVNDAPANWSLVGVYFIGATFNRRCFMKYGGDVAILTQYGLISMNGVAQSQDGSPFSSALSIKIQNLISELTTEGSSREGWQLVNYPAANMVLVNVPGVETSQNAQLAFNTVRQAWCTFTGMPASCWMTTRENLLFGTIGAVYRAWEGTKDKVEYNNEGGNPITASVQQSFSFFDNLSQDKHFKMVRPTFLTDGNFDYNIGINTDYQFDTVDAPKQQAGINYGMWDNSDWDDAYWSGGTNASADWVGVVGIGFTASLIMTFTSTSEVTWLSTNWLFEAGGPI
jgi:hypothetical protein